MRFGSRVSPVSHNPDDDGDVVDRTLREVELSEAVGMDAVWLTEHYFSGECVYGDPLVFGAAVAAKTSRIKIGFAVVQMALHNPVRLAVQTALIDNLSHGRLIVGTGRGTSFNHYEYAGFGTTMEEGAEMLAEAEELLVKAWTGRELRFEGRYWQVSLPMLRPRPFQRPHPPMPRACITESSMREMGRVGRPILTGDLDNDAVRRRLESYRDAMAAAGFDEAAVDDAVDQSWLSKNLCVADSYEEAREIAYAAYIEDMHLIRDARRRYNPPEDGAQTSTSTDGYEEKFERLFILGTPSQVAEEVAEIRDAGVRNLMLENSFGGMTFDQVRRTLTRFGEEVAPLFR